jgi:hypothetical protein
MFVLAPPPRPPLVAVGDNDGLRRVRFRLYQIVSSMITVFVTAWFCTLGPVPAIVACCFAKHILVAILLMGLRVDAPEGMPL